MESDLGQNICHVMELDLIDIRQKVDPLTAVVNLAEEVFT